MLDLEGNIPFSGTKWLQIMTQDIKNINGVNIGQKNTIGHANGLEPQRESPVGTQNTQLGQKILEMPNPKSPAIDSIKTATNSGIS